MNFRYDAGQLTADITEFELRVNGAISAAVDYHATRGEAVMKLDAPWTDRTSAARNGLHTSTFHELRIWTIVFAHAVEYGIWLETRSDFDGRYAIIMPSVIAAGRELMRTLENLFGRV